MMRSFFSRGVLTLLITMSISTCRPQEDDTPSTIKESTALGSTLTFNPVTILVILEREIEVSIFNSQYIFD